jgi:hypothetical protein
MGKRIFRKVSADSSILALNFATEQTYDDNVLWDLYAWYFYYSPVEIKRNFFAVIVHGSPDKVAGGDGDNLFRVINNYYNNHGYDRALLMLSCYSGINIAPTLAKRMKVPVIAGTSAVTNNSGGNWQVVRLPKDKSGEYRLTWVCCYESKKKVICTTVLYPRAAIGALRDVGWQVNE